MTGYEMYEAQSSAGTAKGQADGCEDPGRRRLQAEAWSLIRLPVAVCC